MVMSKSLGPAALSITQHLKEGGGVLMRELRGTPFPFPVAIVIANIKGHVAI